MEASAPPGYTQTSANAAATPAIVRRADDQHRMSGRAFDLVVGHRRAVRRADFNCSLVLAEPPVVNFNQRPVPSKHGAFSFGGSLLVPVWRISGTAARHRVLVAAEQRRQTLRRLLWTS